MAGKGNAAATRNRIHWMDNLRTIIIFLVVLYHVGGIYEGSGIWASFWIVDDPATNNLVGILNIVIDIFVMPTLFFISGYLTPASLKSRDGWAFLGSRFRRLIVPWIVAVLTLIPLYKVLFLYARGLPQEHWTTYFHFSQENITSQSWLWFLPVLFLFNVLYLLLSKTKIRMPNIPLKAAVLGAFLIGLVYSLGIGAVLGFRSWTLTPLIDFENDRLLLYFMVFLLGALCFRQQVFQGKPQGRTLYIVASSIAWLPITVHIFSRLIPFLVPGGVLISPLADRLIFWLSFYFSLLCLLYLMIESFWRYLDRTSVIWDELNKNSYGVYIIHVIVLGVIALFLLNSAIPSLLKYLIVAISTILACNLIVSLYRRAATSMKAISQPKVLSSSRQEL